MKKEIKPAKGVKFYATINDESTDINWANLNIDYPRKEGVRVCPDNRVVELTITRVFVRESPLKEVENEITL